MIDPQYVQKKVEEDNPYPTGEELQKIISRRRRSGSIWRWGFLVATIVAIIILIVLLITIINQSFGLVAEQVEIPEEALVTDYNKSLVLAASNIIDSAEDDQLLAEGVAGDPLGAGFFGYAYYKANQNDLRALTINGITPTSETVNRGEYEGTRPLFVYTSPTILEENQAAGAFLLYYLDHLDEVIEEVGYFPADPEVLAGQQQKIAEAMGFDSPPAIDPAAFDGKIAIVGSSTVYPVTQMMAERFVADGFPGEITVNSVGTGGGFAAFCFENGPVDIVDASRPVDVAESDACQAAKRSLTEIHVGTDAVAAAVSRQNEFIADINNEQLVQLFSSATKWSDLDSSWPDQPIHRYIPTADSGTMDFFAQTTFAEQTLSQLPYDSLVEIYTANVSKGRCRAIERDQRFYADRYVCDDQQKYETACASDNPPTGCTAEPRDAQNIALLLQAEVVKPQILQSCSVSIPL